MNWFNPGSPEEQSKTRQSVLHSAYDALNARNSGLQNFPVFLEECLEKRVWESPRTLGSGRQVEPTSFHDFIHQPFPVGLGTTYEAVESVIADKPSLAASWRKLTGRAASPKLANVVLLPLADIRLDGGTQSRAALRDETISEYAERYESGGAMPPVDVFYDGESYWLVDGFHRCNGAIKAGKDSVLAEIHQGTHRDAVLFSVGVNDKHGLPRTNADKRRSVEKLLRDEEWSTKSDRWIAERCRVGHPLVAQMKRELEDLPVNNSAPRLGQDGKTRKLPKRKAEPETPTDTTPEIGFMPDEPAPHTPKPIEAAHQYPELELEPAGPRESRIVSDAIGLVCKMSSAELYDFEERFNELLQRRRGDH